MTSKRLFALALVALLFCLAASSQARQDNKDKDALAGSWTVTKAEENGKAVDELAKAKVTLKGDTKDSLKMTVKLAMEKDAVDLTVTIDPGKTPKSIDVRQADNKDPAQGIYELGKDGKTLKLCVQDPGGKRPGEFKSAAKGVVYLELTKD